MNIGESGAVRKFRCCDAAKRRAHSRGKERLTPRHCRLTARRTEPKDGVKLREITDLMTKSAVSIVTQIGYVSVMLKRSGPACKPKSGMHDSHAPIAFISELLFIVCNVDPDLATRRTEATIRLREHL